MAELGAIDCPYCGDETVVLLPDQRDTLETSERLDSPSPEEAHGMVWTRCDEEHKFVVYYQ